MTAFLVVVAVLAVIALVLIVVAPWKGVRAEPKLDKADEAKILLRRDPDEPTAEYRAVRPGDDDSMDDSVDDAVDPDAAFSDLAALDADDDR